MKTMIKGLTITAMMLLVACSSIRQPDWTQGNDDRYPEQLYLTADGVADHPEQARRRALANLAQVFEVAIQDELRDETAFNQQAGGDADSRTIKQTVSRTTTSQVTLDLQSAEIVETWYDDDKNQYHALAAIKRGPLISRWSAAIQATDRQIKQRLRQAASAEDSLQAARLTFEARELFLQRSSTEQLLRSARVSGQGMPSSVSLAEINQQLAVYLVKIKVTVNDSTVNHNLLKDNELKGMVEAGTRAVGLKLMPPDQARFVINASLDNQPVEVQQDWYWYRGHLQLDWYDEETDQQAYSYRLPLKVSAQQPEVLSTRLKTYLSNWFNNQWQTALLTDKDTHYSAR